MKSALAGAALALLFALNTAYAEPVDAGASGTPSELDRVVAVVNDDVVLRSEVDEMMHTVKQQAQSQQTRLPADDVLRNQVLERLVLMHLQLQLATQTGIRIDDETLNEAVNDIARQNRLSLGEFRNVLEREGFSFERFREQIRDQIAISRLQQRQIGNLVNVTDQEVDNFLASQQQNPDTDNEYHLAHILIALPEAASPEQIQAGRARAQKVLDDLRGGADFAQTAVAVSNDRQALEGGDLGWRTSAQIPSLFVDVVRQLQPGGISELIRSPSGFHIIRLVDVRGMDKHVVTQTHARHILIRSTEIVSEEEARTRLAQLKQRIEDGDDFGALARAHSEDDVSAAKGGDLDWVSPGDLVPQFEAEMNGLRPGAVSEPFNTQFGWHIVQVLERRQHDDTAEFRRSRARELIRKRKSEEELDLWLRRLRDEAYVEYRLDE